MKLHQLKIMNYIALVVFIGLVFLMQQVEGVWDTVVTVVIIVGVLVLAFFNWFWAKCPHCGSRQKEINKVCWRCKRPLDVEI